MKGIFRFDSNTLNRYNGTAVMEVLSFTSVFVQRIFSIIWFVGFVVVVPSAVAIAQSDSAVRTPPLLTSWGAEVTPGNAHSEYPRPTLVRSEWLNLNGYWDWKDSREQQDGFTRRILVPFPVESALSGIAQPTERCTYRRSFTIPSHWNDDHHILLHFGAVDWEANVFVNGHLVGTHRGGYDPFSLDITAVVRRHESNELVVQVFDPSQKGEQPRGKQSTHPSGIWYTASSGIWQTVWLEPVPPHHITTLQIHADYQTGIVTILPILNAPHKDLTVAAEVLDAEESVAKSYGGSDGTLLIDSKRFERFNVKPWSPDSPHLYGIRVQLLFKGSVVDTVDSYFAFRNIAVVKGNNDFPTVHLNGKRLFLMGVIDQGYWSDGLYTAPSDAAQRMDIRVAKESGFNVIRKYHKIEPERWYFWCDQLGILVLQDMPNGENRSSVAQQQFRTELQRMIQCRSHHPSIIAWTIFNEGGGQHNVPEYVELVRHLDPTRLINATSGWRDNRLGDFNISHKFPGPEMPAADANRAAVIGLFGGLTLVPPVEHLWTENTWGHQHVADSVGLVQRYKQMHEELRRQIRTQGLAGAFFHQLSDIEGECNGLTTYDRHLLKVPEEVFKQINQETIRIGSE